MTHSTSRRVLGRLLLSAWALVVDRRLAACLRSASCRNAVAAPTQPSATDRQIVGIVSMLMENQHLSRHRLDDTISERCLDTFIKELDPLKLFFYQSDVDEFMTQQDQPGRPVQARRHPICVRRFRPIPDPRRRARQHRARPSWTSRTTSPSNEEMIRDPDDDHVSPRRPKRRPSAGGNA